MNNMGFSAIHTMRRSIDARRYMAEIYDELIERGIARENIWWIWEVYEHTAHFLYELKHKPETYNMPAKERVDQILIVVAIALQVNQYYWRGWKDYFSRKDLLKIIIQIIKDCKIEDKYMSEIEVFSPEVRLIRFVISE